MSPSDPRRTYLLASVGSALSQWSLVETGLALLFATISDIPGRAKAGAIYDAIVAFKARLTVCDRLMALEEIDPIDLKIWNKFSQKARELYRKRHEIAHFTQMFEVGKEPVIAPFFSWDKERTQTNKYLTTDQISQRAKKFSEFEEAVRWFYAQALTRRGIAVKVRGQSLEEPPLIAQLRVLASQTPEEASRKLPPSEV